jgi:hypothetical protein
MTACISSATVVPALWNLYSSQDVPPKAPRWRKKVGGENSLWEIQAPILKEPCHSSHASTLDELHMERLFFKIWGHWKCEFWFENSISIAQGNTLALSVSCLVFVLLFILYIRYTPAPGNWGKSLQYADRSRESFEVHPPRFLYTLMCSKQVEVDCAQQNKASSQARRLRRFLTSLLTSRSIRYFYYIFSIYS